MIDLDRVRDIAKALAEDNPDATNPRDSNQCCLYTKQDDDITPNAAAHCFAGMVLVALDIPLPAEYTPAHSFVPVVDSFTEEAITYLRFLQRYADHSPYNSETGYGRTTWSSAFSRTDARYMDEISRH